LKSRLKRRHRGELEITAVNQCFLEENELKVQVLRKGFAWLDTGTNESLTEATEFVKSMEKRTGLKIACLEEIAINNKWIDKNQVVTQVKDLKGDYFEYLKKIINP
jgi:glucose-1-phosphate thymidylyltransferase